MIKAIQRAERAILEKMSSFNIALAGLRPSTSLGAQTPQLRFGHILSMVNLLFCVSKTYVARRAYSEAKRAMFQTILLILFILSVAFLYLDRINRIHRIEEEVLAPV